MYSNNESSVVNNLYELFDFVGTNITDFNFHESNSIKVLKSKSSVWPNVVYNTNNSIDNNFFATLADINNEVHPDAVFIYKQNDDAIKLFQKNNFLLVDRWIGMSMELESERSTNHVYSDILYSDVFETDLDEWINVVSNCLFRGGSLDKRIFVKLIQQEHQISCIRKNGKIVGTSVLFYDSCDVAGIYMFCIDKQERGKGLGKTLLNFTLNKAYASGKRKVVLQATRIGYPLYLTAGFSELEKINLFIKK